MIASILIFPQDIKNTYVRTPSSETLVAKIYESFFN